MVKMQLIDGTPDDLAGVERGDVKVVYIPKGMKSGRAAIVLLVSDDNGNSVSVKTTAKLFLEVADAVREKDTTKH